MEVNFTNLRAKIESAGPRNLKALRSVNWLWKYDLVLNALVGAAIGVIFAHQFPIHQPYKSGAVLGALLLVILGIYKNLGSKSTVIRRIDETSARKLDVADELMKFDGLRKSGAITEAEYATQKRKLLDE